MIDSLTSAQQVFAVFYGIFFGTMLQMIGSRRSLPSLEENNNRSKLQIQKNPYINTPYLSGASLNLFDTPNAWAIGAVRNNKPLYRALLSILCLNILPGLLFAYIFNGLQEVKGQLIWSQIIVIVWISLSPHWIYRGFYAILARFYSSMYITNPRIHKRFNDFDLAAVAVLWEERLRFKGHKSSFYHLAFPLFGYVPSALISYTYLVNSMDSHVRCVLVAISITLALVGLIFFLCRVETN